jgi:hypothetical protein
LENKNAKKVIDIRRGCAIKYSDFISIYPYVKKFFNIYYPKLKANIKNANPNNYVYFYKRVIDIISDPKNI